MSAPRWMVALSSVGAVLATGVICRPVVAQEYEGCFLIDDYGNVVDLSNICGEDEGGSASGLGTGDVQVTLRWSTEDDLDLAVSDPAGDLVSYFNPQIASGGQLDVDANAACENTTESPVENVFWPTGRGVEGTYTVEVALFSVCGQDRPVDFNISVLVLGETQTLRGTVSSDSPIASFEFSLPLSPGSSAPGAAGGSSGSQGAPQTLEDLDNLENSL